MARFNPQALSHWSNKNFAGVSLGRFHKSTARQKVSEIENAALTPDSCKAEQGIAAACDDADGGTCSNQFVGVLVVRCLMQRGGDEKAA